MKNIYFYSIEGNIGSGKSTVIKKMKQHIEKLNNNEVIYLPEPVEIWSTIKDKDGIIPVFRELFSGKDSNVVAKTK